MTSSPLPLWPNHTPPPSPVALHRRVATGAPPTRAHLLIIIMADVGAGGDDDDLLDPHPDAVALFRYYNALYFEGKLDFCSVEWSTSRMTLCAGVCHYQHGGGCRIKLSEPLLKVGALRWRIVRGRACSTRWPVEGPDGAQEGGVWERREGMGVWDAQLGGTRQVPLPQGHDTLVLTAHLPLRRRFGRLQLPAGRHGATPPPPPPPTPPARRYPAPPRLAAAPP